MLSGSVFAHNVHHDEMKASQPLPGASLYQLQVKWKNQRGETVTMESLKGKPRLVVMLFTLCETACPLIVDDMKEIAQQLGKDTEVSLFSLDSSRETPETLTAFAEKRRLPSNWSLYAGDKNAVAELAAALGVRYKRLKSGDYIHSNVIYFLDENGVVKASKEGIKTNSSEFLKKIK
jgi:protein SCO1/2